MTYTDKEGRRVSCLTQTDLAAFGKVVQLISTFPYVDYLDGVLTRHSMRALRKKNTSISTP